LLDALWDEFWWLTGLDQMTIRIEESACDGRQLPPNHIVYF